MAQTRAGSFVESWANIAIGFTLNWTVNIAVLPILWNPNSPKLSAFYIGCVFTVFSFVRSFAVRRIFNRFKWSNRNDPAN